MAKSRARGKKFNPCKARRKAMQHFAEKCYLYAWESYRKAKAAELYGCGIFAFSGHETLTRKQQEAACQWAMNRHTRWVALIHACYVVDAGEYYEETVEFVTPPVRLADNAEDVEDLLRQGIKEAESGNPKHHIDTVIVLRPFSQKFARMADDDEWCKRQAAYRSKIIMNTVRETA